MITIMLPWPDKDLSPNARVHWRKKAEAVKLAREVGHYSAHGREIEYNGRFVAEFIFHPPDRRRRDLDNCLASCKSYIDGVCDYVGIDDSQIKRKTLEWGALVEGGSVELRIGAITKTADSGNTDDRYYRKDE